jgi:hypothetical protein
MPSGKRRIERKRLPEATDVVESDAICMALHRPNQDDVTCESASLIRLGRDIRGGHLPRVDRQPPQDANVSCRIRLSCAG